MSGADLKNYVHIKFYTELKHKGKKGKETVREKK